MAGQPLSPATDRRLGGPLPRQLSNQTRGHLRAINLWQQGHATSLHHAVLAQISLCYSPLQGRFLTRYSPVRHFPLNQLSENSVIRFSFDLHVLSTPPAFILSQDQTLNKIVSKRLAPLKSALLKLYLSFKIELTSPFFTSLSSLFQKDSVLLVLRVSLRCLIYKVQTARSGEVHLSTFALLCQVLFSFSQYFHPKPCASRELCYLTTPAHVCQALFSHLSVRFLRKSRRPHKRFANIPDPTRFVNTFFALFRFFLFPSPIAFPSPLCYACRDRL